MSSTSIPPLRIAVVGGGIAGLTSALALLNAKSQKGANIDVQVYESAHEFAEIGAGVSFGPNAQRALRMLGLTEVLAEVGAGEEERDPDTWFQFVVGEKGVDSGKRVTTMVGEDAARGSVHRADFLDCLIRRFPSEFAHFNHRATSYTTHDGGITLHFSESPRHPAQPDVEADVVIASDGVKSILRRELFTKAGLDPKSQEARYSEWIAWRQMIPVETFRAEFGQEINNKLMIVGKNKHILTFPVKKGAMINLVGFVRDASHLKLGDHTGPWSEERPKAEMLADYDSFNEKTLQLLNEIDQPSIWGIFDLPEITHVLDEGLVLIGDAAHGTTPHQGSGAGQAVEDALFISSILTYPKITNAALPERMPKVKHALKVYAEARQERGNNVVKTSREAGMLYEFLGPEGNDLELMKANLDNRMGWIWNWDTAGELEKAIAKL